MNVRARSVGIPRTRAEAGSGFLYGWLLVALFVEYARPSNQLPWLEFPFFYSIVPMSLLVVSMFAPGLRPMKDIFADRLAKWVLIFFGIILLSFVFTGFSSYASGVMQTVLGYVFLFILIARIVMTEERLRLVIVTLVIAHVYLLAVNLEVLTNPSERQYLTGGTFLGDGNDYSLSLCILFPCMVEVALSSRKFVWKLLAWASSALIVLAIIATQSRGGTLGLAAVLLYLWLRSTRKMVSMVGIAMVGLLVLIYAPPQYFQRMGTVSSMTIDGSAQGRIDMWKASIGMVAHNPVLGIGAGHFGPRWRKTAHSTYFLVMGELGLPGLLCVWKSVV